ncbi:tRNA-dihydrouridine synthase family protein [Candidatus Woesearchaeota archaeon]|nr:tRNA-dihydrouridine synthase family protein [Candidatus Woesearchaeota archaeon]
MFKYFLAPLEDCSDNALRTLCHRYGADLTFTEMTRVEGLAKRNKATWRRLEFHDSTPVAVQLLAGKEDQLKRVLTMFKPHQGFQGFNFNLACPSPDVIKQGRGCAMVKRIQKTRKLIKIVKDYGYPISLKIRLGMNELEKSRKVYLNLIDGTDPDFFIIHARVGTQHYETPADYSVYPECIDIGKPIIANGDINTKEKVAALKSMGVQGVMIGRFAVRNPAIFNKLKGESVPTIEQLKKEYLKLAEKYNAPYKYQKNILKRLGQEENKQDTKEEETLSLG